MQKKTPSQKLLEQFGVKSVIGKPWRRLHRDPIRWTKFCAEARKIGLDLNPVPLEPCTKSPCCLECSNKICN